MQLCVNQTSLKCFYFLTFWGIPLTVSFNLPPHTFIHRRVIEVWIHLYFHFHSLGSTWVVSLQYDICSLLSQKYHIILHIIFLSSLEDMVIDFRERGREEERQRERNIHPLPLICAPTWGWTCNPGMCPDWESNPQPSGLWEDAPTNWTIPAGQGLSFTFLKHTVLAGRQPSTFYHCFCLFNYHFSSESYTGSPETFLLPTPNKRSITRESNCQVWVFGFSCLLPGVPEPVFFLELNFLNICCNVLES